VFGLLFQESSVKILEEDEKKTVLPPSKKIAPGEVKLKLF